MESNWRYVVITATATVCYLNTLYGTFVFDDTEAIVKNKDVTPHVPLYEIFRNDFWGTDISLNVSHKSYRPLTILSYRLNLMFAADLKLNAFHFHATNVALFNTLCLLMIPTYKMFLRNKDSNIKSTVPYFSTLLFTVHPVHTEAVAGLVGRADILSAIFVLMAILLYGKIVKYNSLCLFPFVILLVFLGVLCKETAITSLPICSVCDVIYGKIFRKGNSLKLLHKKSFFFRNMVLVAAAVLILYFRLRIMNFVGPTFTASDNPAAFSELFFTKTLSYLYVYFLNFLILIWPQWLCFDWSMGCIPLITSFCDKRILLVLIFCFFITYSCCKYMKKLIYCRESSIEMMGFSLLIIPFIPASNLFFKVGFVIAERTLLLPSIGFCFLVVLGFTKLKQKNIFPSNICDALFYILCVIFAIRTIIRNFEWLNEESLFMSGVNVCPSNAKVHYNIAKVAADNNNRELAIIEYRQAINLNPYYEQAMNNLANLLREDSKFFEAEDLLRKALIIRPNFAAAWMNLGIVLTNLNKTDEAEQCYLRAISHRHKYPDCYYNLGNLYLDLKRHHDALKAWEMAVEYKPTHTAAWSNMLVLLDSMQYYKKVLDLGKTALMHNPKSPALHFSIANTLGKVQHFEQAEKHFLEALNLNPNNALYYSNLGVLYHRWRKIDKAHDMYKKALQLDPTMKTTEINLKKLIDKY